MRQELYKSKFKEIWWDESHKIIGKRWYAACGDMTDKEFQHEMRVFGEWVRKLKPKGEMVNTLNFNYTVNLVMQEWVSNEIFKIYDDVGLRKGALIIPANLISKLALVQAMDENYGQKLQKRYFKTESEAMEWLLT